MLLVGVHQKGLEAHITSEVMEVLEALPFLLLMLFLIPKITLRCFYAPSTHKGNFVHACYVRNKKDLDNRDVSL